MITAADHGCDPKVVNLVHGSPGERLPLVIAGSVKAG